MNRAGGVYTICAASIFFNWLHLIASLIGDLRVLKVNVKARDSRYKRPARRLVRPKVTGTYLL